MVSLLVGHSPNVDVSLVFVDDDGRLVVANVAGKGLCTQFRNGEAFFLRWFGWFRTGPNQMILVGDWNAILDPR